MSGDFIAFSCETMRHALALCKSLSVSAQTWYEYCQGQDVGVVCIGSDVVRIQPGTGYRIYVLLKLLSLTQENAVDLSVQLE